jgi:hypothetical protein
MNIHPLLKSKWFWIGVAALFVFAIIWDVVLASTILVKSVTSGKWSTELLGLGVLYALTILYQRRVTGIEKKRLRSFGKLVLLVIAIIAFHDHGFWQMLYFLTTVFIFSTFMKWIVGLFTRKKHHKREPFIVSE